METEETTQSPIAPRSPRKRKPDSELLSSEETILYDLWEVGPTWTEEEVVFLRLCYCNERSKIKTKSKD